MYKFELGEKVLIKSMGMMGTITDRFDDHYKIKSDWGDAVLLIEEENLDRIPQKKAHNNSDSSEIKIKYFDKTLPKVDWIDVGDWIDVYTREDITLEKGEHVLIPLNIAMALPKEYEAELRPRSSTFGKFGILMANSVGTIDNSFSGDDDEWKFSAYATRDAVIPKGTRIGQFKIVERMDRSKLKFVEVDRLGENRGGFGTTGTN